MNYLQILKFKNYNILIKANDEALKLVTFTNLTSLKDFPNDITQMAKNELLNYFSYKDYDFSKLKLDLNEFSPFTQNILLELKYIEYGKTTSYKDLAKRLNSKAYQAIGTALSKNPYMIILPCHRVIRSDASIGKFTCCVDGMKEILLKHEKGKKC